MKVRASRQGQQHPVVAQPEAADGGELTSDLRGNYLANGGL